MWVRKKIDIHVSQLTIGLWNALKVGSRGQEFEKIDELWSGSQETFVCLSVRSGFDALLTSLQLPAKSEIIMSGLTIPDMPRIVRNHELVPVPIDLEIRAASPDVEQIRKSITPRTRALVIAHLFGSRVDLAPFAKLAKQHNLLLIEDCAQAYIGNDYTGSDIADISMFSFGPIKTNTSLGGGIFSIRRPEIKVRVEKVQRSLPRQPQMNYFKRLLKYVFVKSISTRIGLKLVWLGCWMVGKSHDKLASKMARSFPGPDFIERIRHQPPLALVKMLVRRLRGFDKQKISRRIELAELFQTAVGDEFHVWGSGGVDPSYWVLPILVENPEALTRALWKAGFDATTQSSLEVISEPGRWQNNFPRNANAILERIVFLPFSESMPEKAILTMASIVRESATPYKFETQKTAADSQIVAIDK